MYKIVLNNCYYIFYWKWGYHKRLFSRFHKCSKISYKIEEMCIIHSISVHKNFICKFRIDLPYNAFYQILVGGLSWLLHHNLEGGLKNGASIVMITEKQREDIDKSTSLLIAISWNQDVIDQVRGRIDTFNKHQTNIITSNGRLVFVNKEKPKDSILLRIATHQSLEDFYFYTYWIASTDITNTLVRDAWFVLQNVHFWT